MTDAHRARAAVFADLPRLRTLIDASVRGLSEGFYSPAQIESALRHVFGPDSQLIADGTYYVVESDSRSNGEIIAAGGWSGRRTMYGGDQMKTAEDSALDPAREPARIRAFYVHPAWSRRGLGRFLLDRCTAAARAAGFRELELVATPPGEPLYAALGFMVTERSTIVLPDGVELPFAHMRRSIATRAE